VGSLHENPRLLEQLRQKLFLLWGPLEESSSSVTPPKPIRKQTNQRKNLSVRFSDELSYDDDSSSSLDARYPSRSDDDEPVGGKIIKTKGTGRLPSSELKSGVWFNAGIKEFWVRENEAVFGARRWRLFGTKIL